jgi:hypothetical protein
LYRIIDGSSVRINSIINSNGRGGGQYHLIVVVVGRLRIKKRGGTARVKPRTKSDSGHILQIPLLRDWRRDRGNLS